MVNDTKSYLKGGKIVSRKYSDLKSYSKRNAIVHKRYNFECFQLESDSLIWDLFFISAPVLFANPRRQVFSRRGPYNFLFAVAVNPCMQKCYFCHSQSNPYTWQSFHIVPFQRKTKARWIFEVPSARNRSTFGFIIVWLLLILFFQRWGNGKGFDMIFIRGQNCIKKVL